MAARKKSSSTKRTGKTAAAQGLLPEPSRLPRPPASGPATRKVKASPSAPSRVGRTASASSAEARALLGLSQGTPGAGRRAEGERPEGARRKRAPSADELAREAVRRERPLSGGALQDLNLRTGRDLGALRAAAKGAAPAGRATSRTQKDRGGTSLRTRR
ncbi:hypothetical protein FGE12_28845 [Aggregicoccus sp. 17bor-14]|uniref:hypothetical protein n=1 Tax=Myxococcaceae TaxID=31 RepID=UPI00129CF31E|nr:MULTISPECIES: hypothetical protein [Myxococcaceae]MBF5046456.1 hypothetical protein [Simulacricoccus sp. 17bor-14]MRI92174.1 hypothetical protein [Aggregicoccus sp. 17bor-14]